MIGAIEPLEVEWIAWALMPEGHRRLQGRGTLDFEELVAEVERTIEADLEKVAAMPAELRNRYALSEQYGFAAGTLAERLREFGPDERAQLLDARGSGAALWLRHSRRCAAISAAKRRCGFGVSAPPRDTGSRSRS